MFCKNICRQQLLVAPLHSTKQCVLNVHVITIKVHVLHKRHRTKFAGWEKNERLCYLPLYLSIFQIVSRFIGLFSLLRSLVVYGYQM